MRHLVNSVLFAPHPVLQDHCVPHPSSKLEKTTMSENNEDAPTASGITRRGFTAMVGAGLALGATDAITRGPSARAAAQQDDLRRRPSPAFRNAMSISPFTDTMFRRGLTFTDGNRTARSAEALQRLFVAHGASELYARIATSRFAQQDDAEHGFLAGLDKARLARRLGLPFNPELGLWKIYGDVSHQPAPDFSNYPKIRLTGPWSTLTLAQMTDALRQYGTEVAQQILRTGVDVNVWDLGNEVEFGVAGVALRSFTESTDYFTYAAPDNVDPEIGRISVVDLFSMPDRNAFLEQHLWPYVGALFAAVADGIRRVDRHARFTTHTSTVSLQLPGLLPAFWQAMSNAGFEVDEFGVSYYPTSSGGTLATFQATVTALKAQFGRPVFIAEGGYPTGTMDAPFAWNSPLVGYPQDEDGQSRFYRDVTAWGRTTGVLSGIRPWAPDYSVGGWQPMSFFTPNGTRASAKPALGAIASGLRSA